MNINNQIDCDNQNKSDLLSRIPLISKYILEVGCGNGSLGHEFKRRQPYAKYFGIETAEKTNIIAKKRLDLVYESDIKETLTWINKIPPLDCLIYGESLEKLKDPYACISHHSSWLKDNGVLIACIQNIQHWSIYEELFSSSLQTDKRGLFSEDFVQVFTLRSITEIIINSGLNICEIKPSIISLKEVIKFADKIEPALDNLNIDKNIFIRNTAPLQYVIIAKKGNYKRLHIDILKSKVNPPVIAESRIHVPFKALNTLPDISNSIGEEIKLLPANSKIPRIMILNRGIFKRDKESLHRLRTLLKTGYIIIIDLDDDPTEFLLEDNNYDFSLRSCHAIQVSTTEIAEKVSLYNSEIKIFPNVIERIGDIKNDLNSNSKIKIFFGALNRENDWEPWINALNKALSIKPTRWEFEIIHDKLFYNSINLPKSQIKFTPLCSYSKYLDIMSNSDICFMPLLDNDFNKCKSDLKALEAASFSLAILANPVVYNKTFINGETAQFFNDNQTLMSILNTWEENPQKIRELGNKAREYVMKNRLASQQVSSRSKWYKELWDRRDKLKKDLIEREPGLYK